MRPKQVKVGKHREENVWKDSNSSNLTSNYRM
jgi:hypothetical protein